MLIQHILHRKGGEVETIPATATVADAVARLRDRNIGALVVTDEPGREAGDDAGTAASIAGILSERDIVRALAGAEAPLDQPVRELMTTEVTTCGAKATVDELMRLMTDRRIRHIPVVEGGRLVGIVSIGDVVKHKIDSLQFERDQLDSYVHQT